MAGDSHDTEAQEEPQASEDGRQQAAQDEPQVSSSPDYERAIAERDERIAALEAQVAGAARSAEAADELRKEIAELKAQGESDRIDFQLQLAGVRNVKAARAVLAARRRALGLRQVDVAEMLGTTANRLSKSERGVTVDGTLLRGCESQLKTLEGGGAESTH